MHGVNIERAGRVTPIAELCGGEARRFSEPPKVAVVVGTFAAVPYVHLHLEARRRFYPEVPLLVHDDGSPKSAELAALCRDYGADFERNTPRLPPCKGDLCAFAGGLAWAGENGAGLLVKMSRRFVPLGRWVDGLVVLAEESDYATYNAWTTSFNFGFRTECLALAVEEWSGMAGEIVGAIQRPSCRAWMTSSDLSFSSFLKRSVTESRRLLRGLRLAVSSFMARRRRAWISSERASVLASSRSSSKLRSRSNGWPRVTRWPGLARTAST